MPLVVPGSRFAERLRAAVRDDVDRLIGKLLGLRQTDEEDAVNFEAALEFVYSNFDFHRFLDTNDDAINRQLHALTEKFRVHSRSRDAQALQFLAGNFLRLSPHPDHVPGSPHHYNCLRFLLLMANRPTAAAYTFPGLERIQPVPWEASVDWREVLGQRSDPYQCDYDQDSDGWSQLSDDALAEDVDDPGESAVEPGTMAVADGATVSTPPIVDAATLEASSEASMTALAQWLKAEATVEPAEHAFQGQERLDIHRNALGVGLPELDVRLVSDSTLLASVLARLRGFQDCRMFTPTNELQADINVQQWSRGSLTSCLRPALHLATSLDQLRQVQQQLHSLSDWRAAQALARCLSQLETEWMAELEPSDPTSLPQLRRTCNSLKGELEDWLAWTTTWMAAPSTPAKRWQCYTQLLDQLTLQIDTLTLCQQPPSYTNPSQVQPTGMVHRDQSINTKRYHAGSQQLARLRTSLHAVLTPLLDTLSSMLDDGTVPAAQLSESFMSLKDQGDMENWQPHSTQPSILALAQPELQACFATLAILRKISQGVLQYHQHEACPSLQDLSTLIATFFGPCTVPDAKDALKTALSRVDATLAPTEAQCWLQHAVTTTLDSHRGGLDMKPHSGPRPDIEIYQGHCQVQLARLLMAFAQRANIAAQNTAVVLLRQRYRLVQSVSDAQQVFLLLHGAWAHQFGSSVFEGLESKRLAGKKTATRLLLTEALDVYMPQLADVLSCHWQEAPGATQPSDDVTDLTLTFPVEWPSSLLLTPNGLEWYNRLFGWLLTLKHGRWALDSLRMRDVSLTHARVDVHRVLLLRARLQHTVRVLDEYLAQRVAESAGQSLVLQLDAATTLTEMQKIHERCLKTLIKRCLLAPQADVVRSVITKCVRVALSFRQLWRDVQLKIEPLSGVAPITNKSFAKIESDHGECHRFLYAVLRNMKSRASLPHLEALAQELTGGNYSTYNPLHKLFVE
eukprot:m.147115 g.147115  ORF g.147115 m.147115 type:complete len:967 (+) comp16250_c0_seq1:163-3063(+)